jgi:tetratricopeptide (TPR) repeat protein
MAMQGWFRRTTWTDEDRIDFNARLSRARKYNRPQYLRIQACHLADAGNHVAALELLEQFFEIDDGGIDLSQAQLQRAESFLATGDQQRAITAFRAALEAERKRPNVQTSAWLLFAWFVVREQLTDLYAEAADVLSEFAEHHRLGLPVSEYRYHCAQAILSAHTGDRATAEAHARQAMSASQAKHSGFRYHPDLGLVQETNTSVHERVRQIVSA